MLHFLSGRRHARAAEQAEVDRALVVQRAELRQEMRAFERETNNLRSAEARMMDALAGAIVEAGRGRRERCP